MKKRFLAVLLGLTLATGLTAAHAEPVSSFILTIPAGMAVAGPGWS